MSDRDVVDDLHPAGIVAMRAIASLILLLVGIVALGALYGTGNLGGQLLAVVMFLPFMAVYFLSGTYLSPKSWTGAVHGIVTLALPSAAIGASSWWLMLTGTRLTNCVVLSVPKQEDSRGVRYEHTIRCGDEELNYTARGEPIGHHGQHLDMLTDPSGLLAPLPSHVAPTGFGWIGLATMTTALVVAVVELVRRLGCDRA